MLSLERKAVKGKISRTTVYSSVHILWLCSSLVSVIRFVVKCLSETKPYLSIDFLVSQTASSYLSGLSTLMMRGVHRESCSIDLSQWLCGFNSSWGTLLKLQKYPSLPISLDLEVRVQSSKNLRLEYYNILCPGSSSRWEVHGSFWRSLPSRGSYCHDHGYMY